MLRFILILVVLLGLTSGVGGCTCKKDKAPSSPVDPTDRAKSKPTKTPVGIPEPPDQPTYGPGGAEYKHASVEMNVYGEGESQYWIFEPASPAPSSAPLVVFNHGWIAMRPEPYGAWLYHIVRRGNIVVYPRYQSGLLTPVKRMTGNAIGAVKDAIKRLEGGDHVAPETDKFAIVGHSLGGGISVNMAAYADSVGLPEPKAMMLVEPGDGANIEEEILANDLSRISSDVLMLIIVGADDTAVGNATGNKILKETSQIKGKNKQLMTMNSDYHGYPPLIADHYAPIAPDDRYGFNDEGAVAQWIRELVQHITGGEVDALDYYGFWKLFDELIDTAFNGKKPDNALGRTPDARFMGRWSDGTPVVELTLDNEEKQKK